MSDNSDLHNELVPALLKQIVKAVGIEKGSGPLATVVLESLICGCLLMYVNPGKDGQGDDEVVDLIASEVKRRMAETRAEKRQQAH